MPVPQEDAPLGVESTAVSDEAPATAPAPLPAPKTCREALARAGVVFADASPSPNIADPVKVAPSIAGVVFRHQADARPRQLWVDCRFAERLERAAVIMRARGVREVIHVGTYEPKCINGATGGGCKPSAHALGMAIDVVSLVREHDAVSIERDFVRRTGEIETCSAPRVGERDTFLKSLVCELDGTFSVLLTPNWDEKHRTHFHLALQPPAKAYWANGVDPLRATE
jgi:hypothetical protein